MATDDFQLVWQSNSAIAVNKPAGVPTQAPKGIESVETRLRTQLNRTDQYLAFPHRLDRDVSGVLLAALTKKAARLLSAQFASRKTAKHYTAVVEGCCDESLTSAAWLDYLRKVKGQSRSECCDEEDEGAKLAETLVHIESVDRNRLQTRLHLSPITGRMHQLRLQTSRRGHPIVGDHLYGATQDGANTLPMTYGSSGDGKDNAWSSPILLHASTLAFHDPTNGRRLEITADCPF